MSDPNSSKFTDKRQLAFEHMEKPNWTIYTLASVLNVKARDIYLPLDQQTRLMFIHKGKLKACHATEGLYKIEPEQQRAKSTRVNPLKLLEQLLNRDQ